MGWAVGFLAAEWGRIDEIKWWEFSRLVACWGYSYQRRDLAHIAKTCSFSDPIGILGGFIGGIWAAFKAGGSR